MDRLSIKWALPLTLALALLFGTVARADVDPDRALWNKAQQSALAGQWAETIITLDALLKDYPDSPFQPDGMVLQYKAYLAQKNPEKANELGKTIIARWPQSDYVWETVLANCKHKAETAPLDAVDFLDLALQQNLLSIGDQRKARRQRLTYLQQAKSDRFLTEALATVNALKPPVSQADLLFAADLAKGAYLPLMQQKRFDEAKALSGKIQELLVRAGNPQGSVQADQSAYLIALKDAGSPRYYDEVTATIKMISMADTVQEARISAELIVPLYLELLQKRPYDEVKALHVTVETALQRLQATDLLQSDMRAWHGGLQNTNPDMFVTEMKEIIAHLKEAKSLTDSFFRVDATQLVYESSLKNRRSDEAKTEHGQVQDFLTRFNQKDDVIVDEAQYACACLKYLRETAKPQYMAEVTGTLVRLADQAGTMDQVRPLVSMVVYYGPYQDLCGVGRTEDARKIFERIQSAILRADAKESTCLNLNLKAYLWEFSRADPEAFLKTCEPLMVKATTGSVDDLKLVVEVVQGAYGALFEAGRTDDAKKIHSQLQTALQRQPTLAATAETELKQFLTSLSQASPQDFIAEIQPVLTRLAKAQTLDEALQCMPLVQMAYGPLNQAGSFQDARTAHEQLQALCKKFNRTAEAEADNKCYQANISVQALDGMLQQFKKAIAANDTDTAKKWLDELNAAALESPQASRARKIWKDNGGK